MAFKFIVFAAFVAVARGGVLSAPVAVAARISDATFDPNPQYSFAYDVQDTLTGDFKSQSETRNGDLVQGQYSLIEPDGTRRIVDYAADSINGFNAVVRKDPLVLAAPAKVVAEPVIAARVAEPLVAAPVVAKARAEPLVAKAAPLTAKPVAAKTVAAPVARTVAAPLLARSAPLVAAPAPVIAARAPLVAAPAASLLAAPTFARLASPYVAAPAPLAYSALPAPLTYAYV